MTLHYRGEERPVELVEQRRFGQADKQPGRVLGDPVSIRTDRAGLVYVADIASMGVLVFDQHGAFVRRLGHRGREAGELMDISSLDVRDDHLVLADSVNGRITCLDLQGELLWHKPMPKAMIWPRWFRSTDEGYLFLFKPPAQQRSVGLLQGFRSTRLFHLYDDGLLNQTAAFGVASKWFPRRDSFEQLYAEINPGSAWLAQDTLVFAPSLYRGRVYRFAKSRGSWKEKGEWRGFVPDAETVREIQAGAERAGGIRYVFSSRYGQLHRLVRHESRGIFIASNGDVFHFIRTTEDDRPVFGVEQYSANGTLLGYRRLVGLPTEADGEIIEYHAMWMDAKGTFYVLARKAFPEIILLKAVPDAATTAGRTVVEEQSS